MIREGLSSNVIKETRLRQKKTEQRVDHEDMKKTQEELLDKKLKELEDRFTKNEILVAQKTEKVKKMGNI